MDDQRADRITIARRFTGPPESGNGGYTAGMLAAAFRCDGAEDGADTGGAVEVTLRRPPPLDTAMPVRRDGDRTVIHLGDQVVAEASAGTLAGDPVEAVSLADAREAETTYPGLGTHPFPTCFTCGPARRPGDGMRLSPGTVGGGRTACTWTPDESLACTDEPAFVRAEFVWASLDCPGGWAANLQGRPMVLGRITGEVDALAEVGERHVLMGRLLGHDDRKTFTATTLYDSDGRVVARAEQVWIVVDPAAFGLNA